MSFSAVIMGDGPPRAERYGEKMETASGGQPVWLAAYTTPRHEKVVARHFEVRNVEYFLPLYRVVRRWKNGCNVPVEFPLFPSYVFVRSGQARSSQLLDIPGLLAFVGPGRSAAQIPDAEMEWLRRELPHRQFEPHPFLTVGRKVRITAGPLTGATGILLRKKNGLRVVLSVELIRQSVAVEVSADEIEPL
jgi:transcription antitermination factor NusG